MTIITFQNGPFNVNTYILQDDQTVLIIDPGAEISDSQALIHEKLSPSAILITHPHIDHVQGIPWLKEQYPSCPVFMSDKGLAFIKEISSAARMFGLPDPGLITIDSPIESEMPFSVGTISITPIHSPGHSPGSLSYLIGDSLFTGDTLFKGTIGRSDLPGGNGRQLIQTIAEKFLILPGNITVYPGHGEKTTVDIEKRTNPYLWNL